MLPRTKTIWVLAGLAVMAAMSANEGVARAGSIGVIGHVAPLPGGSPFLYEFELELEVGTIAVGTSLTVGVSPHGLIGVNTLSGTQQPPSTAPGEADTWILPYGGIVTTGTGPYGTESSVTWDYTSGPTYVNSNPSMPIDLGLFTVETAYSYPDNMPPATQNVTIIDYSMTFADGSTTSGGVVNFTAVPEPSSVFLLLAGGALPLLYRSGNRSRSATAA